MCFITYVDRQKPKENISENEFFGTFLLFKQPEIYPYYQIYTIGYYLTKFSIQQ